MRFFEQMKGIGIRPRIEGALGLVQVLRARKHYCTASRQELEEHVVIIVGD